MIAEISSRHRTRIVVQAAAAQPQQFGLPAQRQGICLHPVCRRAHPEPLQKKNKAVPTLLPLLPQADGSGTQEWERIVIEAVQILGKPATAAKPADGSFRPIGVNAAVVDS